MSRELLKESYTMLLFLPYGASENKQARRDLLDRLNDELAKPEQEPVAWAAKSIYGDFEGLSFEKQPRFDTPLYALDEVTK